MYTRRLLISGLCVLTGMTLLSAQESDPAGSLTGIVYNPHYQPLPGTHILNLSNHRGTTCGMLGIFRIPADPSDTLLITNVAFRDTLVSAGAIYAAGYILLRPQFHVLPVVHIFPWGSTYRDFKNAVLEMAPQQALGESLGLPRADPAHIPYDMDTVLIQSTGFALTSPVSYLYQNFSRKARSARKVYWLERNRELHEVFNAVTDRENIADITGLEGEELTRFMAYLDEHMTCDIHCPELTILSEIFSLFEDYSGQSLQDPR